MYRLTLLCLFVLLVSEVKSQVQPVTSRKDSIAADTIRTKKTDTSKTKYVNVGKIAARKALFSSAILPGLGQIRNGVTFYRMLKVAGIYAGGTMLTLSYIENNNNYKEYSKELIDRYDNNGETQGRTIYKNYPQEGLMAAKDNARRNREVVIFSLAGLYLLNIVEAYVDARLKYFDVGDVAFKVAPAVINGTGMYGFNSLTPGLKITLSL